MKLKKIIDISVLLGYIALVYSTLSVMPNIFLSLRKSFGPSLDIYINILLIAIFVFMLCVFYRKLRRRGLKSYIGLLAVIAVYAAIVIRYTPIVQERMHLVEYGFLGYLALRLFKDVRSKDARYIYVTAVIVLAGSCDEFIQSMLPNRVYELKDISMNILSGLLGLALLRILGYEDPPLDNKID